MIKKVFFKNKIFFFIWLLCIQSSIIEFSPNLEWITIDVKSIEKEIKLKQSTLDFSLPDPDTDPPINDMTIRDLAAIILGKPVSNKEWLNKIIKSK